MKAKTSLAILLVTTALVAQPVFAKEGTDTQDTQLQAKLSAQREAMRTLGHKMMGHINLASVALDTGLPEAAQEHVKKAESLAAQLASSAPELQAKMRFKYGKVSYTVDDQSKDYYVPIVDDLFLLSDYKNTFHRWKDRADIEETDAGVVWLTLSIDIRKVQKELQDAGSKITAKDYDGASKALDEIFDDAVADEVVFTDPVWAVHDNLAFAKNLIDEGHYDGARYALEHAREDLAKVEKEQTGKKEKASESIAKMNDEISKLQAELEKNDPSVSERVSNTFAGWMNTVESWFSSKE